MRRGPCDGKLVALLAAEAPDRSHQHGSLRFTPTSATEIKMEHPVSGDAALNPDIKYPSQPGGNSALTQPTSPAQSETGAIHAEMLRAWDRGDRSAAQVFLDKLEKLGAQQDAAQAQ